MSNVSDSKFQSLHSCACKPTDLLHDELNVFRVDTCLVDLSFLRLLLWCLLRVAVDVGADFGGNAVLLGLLSLAKCSLKVNKTCPSQEKRERRTWACAAWKTLAWWLWSSIFASPKTM
jgi:hypothetical protein